MKTGLLRSGLDDRRRFPQARRGAHVASTRCETMAVHGYEIRLEADAHACGAGDRLQGLKSVTTSGARRLYGERDRRRNCTKTSDSYKTSAHRQRCCARESSAACDARIRRRHRLRLRFADVRKTTGESSSACTIGHPALSIIVSRAYAGATHAPASFSARAAERTAERRRRRASARHARCIAAAAVSIGLFLTMCTCA